MKNYIFIAICLSILISCAGGRANLNNQVDDREIVQIGLYGKHGHIVMFDDDNDRTPDYFEYYNCHPMWAGFSPQLTVKQPDGTYRFGNHTCKKMGFADFRPENQ